MTPVVPVLHRSAALRNGLRRGLRRRGGRVVTCSSIARVRDRLARELVDAIVVDVRVALEALDLIRAYPRIPLFAFSAFRPDDGVLLGACRRAGVCGLLVEGVDDEAASEIIAAHSATRRRRRELAEAPRLLRLSEPVQVRAWDEVLARLGAPITTAAVARALARTREHLSREFGAGGAPNLKRVIDLARVAWAADLLGNPGYTVTVVAGILRFASPSHLAGCARRVAGVSAHQLGALGPRGVLERFLRGRTRSRLRG